MFPKTAVGLIFASQILHGFFYGLTIPLLWAMIADVADFSEWINNRRATAIIFSAMMVGLKVGLSLGSALLTHYLGVYGYVTKEAAASGGIEFSEVIQPDSAIHGIKLLVSIYPSIPFLVCVGLLFFYQINKKMEDKIEKELSERRLKE